MLYGKTTLLKSLLYRPYFVSLNIPCVSFLFVKVYFNLNEMLLKAKFIDLKYFLNPFTTYEL